MGLVQLAMEKLRLMLPLPTELVIIVLDFSDLPYNTHEKKMKLNFQIECLSHKFHNDNLYLPDILCHFPGLYFLRWLVSNGIIKRRKETNQDEEYYTRIRDLLWETYIGVGGLYRSFTRK